MKIGKVLLFLLFLSCLIISGLNSQEVSEKKDVSVFNVSYYGWRFPEEALGSLDSKIRKVFVDMGRFRVLEVRKRFDADSDLYEFIERIKALKEQEAEIPEEVSFGHAIFTESDFNALISSFIVIIPEVVFYDIKRKKNDDGDFIGYDATLRTSYTVLDAQTMEVVAKPEIETTGFSEDAVSAWQSAIDSIPFQLEFEIKKIPIFTLKTGVLEVHGSSVTLEKGKNMGITTGYEFEIIHSEVLDSGLKKEFSTGLVLVKKVFEEVSDATVLYGNPREGDQLVEVPRMGIDFLLYCHALSNLTFDKMSILPGIQFILSRGLYSWKFLVGAELVLADLHSGGFGGYIDAIQDYGTPINFYLGANYNIYMGRLQLAPTAVVGATAFVPSDDTEDPTISHVGGKAYLSVNYLFHRDMKLTFDIGYSYWWSGASNQFIDYSGLLGGITFVYKS